AVTAIVPAARHPSPLDAVLPYFIPGNQTAYFGHFTPVLLYALARRGAAVDGRPLRPSSRGGKRPGVLATLPPRVLNVTLCHVALRGAGTAAGSAAGAADLGQHTALDLVDTLQTVDTVGLSCTAVLSLLVAGWALRQAIQQRHWAGLATLGLVTAALW